LQSRWCNHGGLTPTAPVASIRPPAQLRLLRCTNAYTPRAAGVSPPWRSRIARAMAISEHNHGNTSRNEERRMSARRGDRESPLQKRYRNCSGDCHHCSNERRCRCVTPTTVDLRRPLPVTPKSALTCDSQVPLHARPTTHGGLTPPVLWSSSTRLYTVNVAFPPANERRR